LGVGTQFTCRIPLLLSDDEDTHEEVQPLTSSTPWNQEGEKATILVAEDNEDNYELIEAMIGDDYTLIHAKDGAMAVSLFESMHPHLILMDIKMPVMNGLEAIQAIRRKSPLSPPIIAVSAYAFDQDRKELMENGCKECLTKPFDKELLIATINQYL
jgi:CheY-like chemotaxis protein